MPGRQSANTSSAAINPFLSPDSDHYAMLRVMAILLALGVGLDHYALGGKYRHTAERLAYLLFHRM
jgi:hypothetical protein